ncbi:MAG: hypothetical protein S4CHLAM20_10640 [Chlamydiia bacterium]|nr:hypothetical protein [Chlamydiia bacterium]
MHKNLFLAFSSFFITISNTILGTNDTFNIENLQFVWEKTPNFYKSKKVFLDAFTKCYDTIDLKKLKKSSKEELYLWLDETFNNTFEDYQNNEEQLWLTIKLANHNIGFLIINISKYPDEIYLEQFAVNPKFQRKQIGTSIIDSLVEQFPECKKLAVVTRWVNYQSVNFYKKYGFVESSYTHPGLDPKLYGGFEFIPKKHQDYFHDGSMNKES